MFSEELSFTNIQGSGDILSAAINPSFSAYGLQGPLPSLGSTSSSASAGFTFGQRSETWRQGAGGLPGKAENGSNFSVGKTNFYQRGDEFGQTVVTGDFNGDGLLDIAIGSPGEDSTPYPESSSKKYDEYKYNGLGMVSVMYGSATGLSATNNQTFQNAGAIAFGRSLAAGDFNHDGKMDLAVGSYAGIHILNGSLNGLQQPSSLLSAGSYALEVGDFNGDGRDDLAAGNPLDNSEEGSVSIFYNQANVGLTNSSQVWSQDSQGIKGAAEAAPDPNFNSEKKWGDRFGFSLAAGDFNGDGKDDLAIGTPGERFRMGGISNVPGGAVNVIYGSNGGLRSNGNQLWDQNGTEGAKFNLEGGIEANDQFGYDVKAGDFNGDGMADLAIGVPGEDTSTGGISYDSNGGAVAIIYGKRLQGLTNEGNQLIDQNTPGMAGGIEENDRFGEALAVGDFDYNGFADLAVGIPGETEGSRRGGAVALILGTSTGINPQLNQLFDQSQIRGAKLEDADLFGAALATGDFDGNGSDDLAVGAPGESLGSSIYNHAGEVNVLYGSKFFPTVTVQALDRVVKEGLTARFSLSEAREGTLVKLKSIGTAQLGVDFTVNGASVEGDFVVFRMPAFNPSDPFARTFTVTVLNDNVRENESIAFEVVKGNGYQVKSNQKASVRVTDTSPLFVDTLVDENDGDYSFGDLSLRELIGFYGSGGKISFDPELQGTIVLNSQLLINKNLIIDGPGANRLSISGNNAYRVLEITSGAVVEIEGLAIANGLTDTNGGGILNQGTLTLNNSVLRNNSGSYGGAIHNTGTLTVNNSTLKDNYATFGGGAIYGDLGSVLIRNSTINGNVSLEGGGIYNLSNLTVTNSTLSNNSAVYVNGGGLANGGGIYQALGTATLTNSTVSGNQTAYYGGGIYHADGNLTVTSSTITNNTASWAGSGIYHYRAGGTSSIGSTIVAGNQTLSNSIGDVYGSFLSLDYNLIGDTAGGDGFTQPHDRTGYYGRVLDPKLGLLQDNGGSTWTHALLFDSPAIDAGLLNPYTSDQRGIFSEDGKRDIGAFEWSSPSLSINDVSGVEGNNGIINFDFTVSLDAPSWKPVYVTYMTASGTALPGSDYAATNGNLTFNPGETRKTISVIVVGNTLSEADETFFVNLLSPGNAKLADYKGIGTILNDDYVTLTPEQALRLIADAPDSGTVFNNNAIGIIPKSNRTKLITQNLG